MPSSVPKPGCSLQDRFPDLAEEWHPTRNGSKTPDQMTPFSGKKAWWRCRRGHAWEAVVANRANGNGCIYCANQKPLPGFNDLETRYPEVAKEWHPTRNGSKTPDQVMPGTVTKYWWRCLKLGHEFQASPDRRTGQASGCPVCAGFKILAGFNDLETRYPEVAKEWHPTRNGSKTPDQVMPGSHTKRWWKCRAFGHEWRLSPHKRTTGGHGCPYCSGHQILKGFNDLPTVCPEVAAEWHPTKNGKLSVYEVTKYSNRRMWWLCGKCGYEWRTSVSNRAYGKGCSECKDAGTSGIENRLHEWMTSGPYLEEVLTLGHAVVPVSWRRNAAMRLDILGRLSGTSKNVAIEYDGKYWHGRPDAMSRDLDKTRALLDSGYYVVRVRENGLEPLPIEHPNLFQADYTWHHEDYSLTNLVGQIEFWLILCQDREWRESDLSS